MEKVRGNNVLPIMQISTAPTQRNAKAPLTYSLNTSHCTLILLYHPVITLFHTLWKLTKKFQKKNTTFLATKATGAWNWPLSSNYSTDRDVHSFIPTVSVCLQSLKLTHFFFSIHPKDCFQILWNINFLESIVIK